LRVGTEVIVALPPERIMAALAPLSEPSPALQPKEFPGPFLPREKAGNASKVTAGRISE
jgi:two-component system cell cycle sensor histidine kinase PleC